MHAPDYQIALVAFLSDPANAEKRRRYREAVNALPIDPDIADMTEAEQMEAFCDIYRKTPDAQKPELIRRAGLIVDCLTEEENHNHAAL